MYKIYTARHHPQTEWFLVHVVGRLLLVCIGLYIFSWQERIFKLNKKNTSSGQIMIIGNNGWFTHAKIRWNAVLKWIVSTCLYLYWNTSLTRLTVVCGKKCLLWTFCWLERSCTLELNICPRSLPRRYWLIYLTYQCYKWWRHWWLGDTRH